MKCPVCDIEMRIANREGVEIDYCPQCRGVWLDRGELEKIVARVESQAVGDRRSDDYDRDEDRPSHRRRESESRSDDRYERRDDDYRGGRKREGFLSNLFDMFGD
jgi:hypothetical protein